VRVQITLCGDVTVDETTLVGPARVVLAALVLERAAGLSRDGLAEIVWPDGPPRTWASALRTYASRVRGALATALPPDAGDSVVAAAGAYALVLPDGVELAVDVDEADGDVAAARTALAAGDAGAAAARAAAAAARVDRPFLPGWSGPWVDEVRARLDDVAVAAHEVASAAALAGGDADAALAAADAAVSRAPVRESAHRARWAALAAAGNRAEALRAYQRLRRTLADELGVDPAPETEAAYIDLLGGASRSAADAGRGAPGRPAAPAPFVGREAELAALADAWAEAAAGGRHVVLVTGEAGIGKSRLTSEAARRVSRDGGRVLFGRCDEEAIVPYQPLVEALDGLVAAAPPDEPIAGDDALAELAAVMPSLAGSRRPPGRGGRAGLFEAVTELVVTAAWERPLLLVLDDLQWADDDTLLLVRHLLRRAGDARLLVVAIARDHDVEQGRALGDLVHALDRDGWVRRLPLRGLAEAEVGELVARVEGVAAPATARRLVAETGGNPFLVTELLRGGDAGAGGAIPAGVQDLVATRLARLAPAPIELVRAAAVAGARFDLDVAGAAAGLEGDAMLDALDGALASGLVVEETPERYRFPHDIVRRTLVAQLSGARRRALHGRLADAVLRLRAGDLDAQAAVLAHHTSAGAGPGGDERAVRWARVASAQAAGRHAPAEAVRLCRQALVHVPAGDGGLAAEVTTELGVALIAAGDESGPRTLLDGAALARRHDRSDVAGVAALALADAAAERPDRADLEAEARRLVGEAVALAPGGDALRHARLLVRHVRLGGAAAPPPASALAALAGRVAELGGPGDLDERRLLADELAVLAAGTGDPGCRVRAAHEQAMVAATLGDEGAVDAALARMADAAAGTDDQLAAAAWAEYEVARLTAQGAFAAAAAELPAAVEARRRLAGGASARRLALRHGALLGWLWVEAPPSEAGEGAAGALALEAAGEPVRAAARLREALDDTRDARGDATTLHELGLAALAAVNVAAPDIAAELRARLWPHAERVCGVGYRTFAGAAAFHLGRLAARAAEWSEAERHLLAALRVHTAWRARPWVALTQRELADVLEARGRPADRELIANLRAEADRANTQLGLRPGA
jgi:DNA-binding SARP family transcriptional activator